MSCSASASEVQSYRTFTRAEVAEHCVMEDAWVTCGGYVHDVTPFMNEHPGGASLLKPYLGRDVEEGMEKLGHSSYSYGLLKEYIIGVIEGAELRQHFQPDPKNLRGYSADELAKAVDFSKPTVWQIMHMGDKYWAWVESRPVMNNPLSNGGLKLFYSRFLELNSRWPWWYIWVLWPPVMVWQLYNAFFHSAAATILTQQAAVGGAGYVPLANYTVGASPMDVAPWFTRPMIDVTADSLTFAAIPKAVVATTVWNIFTTFVMGLGIWTFAEYLLHRFVFHFEPHGNFGNWFHYFAHGIHHVTPNDSSRLTFPPLFASVIAFGCHFLFLAHIHKLAKVATCPCQGVYAGILCGYLLYDTAHFFFHNSDFDNRIFRALKTAHMNHHYKNDERNFGVTSPFWDHVFRTWDPQTGKDRAGSGKKRAASAKKAL